MGLISPDIPQVGQETDQTAEPKVSNALQEILDLLNGGLDSANIAPGSITADRLAVTIGASGWQPGMISSTAGTTADTGFLLCDGSAVSRTTYSALFGKIGTRWGTGDGVNTFNLPNLNSTNRTLVGTDGSLPATGTGYAVGATGGEKTHVLTEAEGPAGWVGDDRGTQASSVALSSGDGFYTLDINTGGAGHNNMPPYAAVLYQVKT